MICQLLRDMHIYIKTTRRTLPRSSIFTNQTSNGKQNGLKLLATQFLIHNVHLFNNLNPVNKKTITMAKDNLSFQNPHLSQKIQETGCLQPTSEYRACGIYRNILSSSKPKTKVSKCITYDFSLSIIQHFKMIVIH